MVLRVPAQRGRGGGWPRCAPTDRCGPRAHNAHRLSATGHTRRAPHATARRCASRPACPPVGGADRHWDVPAAAALAPAAVRSAARAPRSAVPGTGMMGIGHDGDRSRRRRPRLCRRRTVRAPRPRPLARDRLVPASPRRPVQVMRPHGALGFDHEQQQAPHLRHGERN
jgi:hypothetical protein